MAEVPGIRWAKSEAGALAYQVFGEGERTLALIIGAISHVERVWEVDEQATFLRDLGTLGRVVLYDERGMGASDPVPGDRPPTLEERVDDLMAVLDAAGIAEADLVGFADGAPVAFLASLAFPDRVGSVVAVQGHARLAADDDYRIGFSAEVLADYWDLIRRVHFDDEAGRANVALVTPSIADDAELAERHLGFLRRACSPGQYVERVRLAAATDVRDLLGLIRKPALVFQVRRSPLIPPTMGRYLADHIRGSKLVEVDGRDYAPFFAMREPLIRELSHFLQRPAEPSRSVLDSRWLATVLFTDIVDSTARAAAMGDGPWRELLEAHDRAAAALVADFRGTLVKSTGDGLLATFDGPSRAVACACALRSRLAGLGIAIRAGVHTGEIESRDQDVAGIGVHVASRIMALCPPGEVFASSTVRDLAVGSGIGFEGRGTHELKGVPGDWHLFAVEGTV